MNAQQIAKGLRILGIQLSSILDPNTFERALSKARADVVESEKLYRQKRAPKIMAAGWGFAIKDPPLRFTETQVNGYPVRVDIVCGFRWKDDRPCRRNIVLRLWALDKRMIYRPEWDARDPIGDLAECGLLQERVMLRFHFDMAAANVPEVRDHLQVAGVPSENTYCWLHPKIDVPRFPYPPMDLFLICELVGANFYEPKYSKIRTESTWKGQILKSQEMLLKEYYVGCCRAIENRESLLLDHLWQRPGA